MCFIYIYLYTNSYCIGIMPVESYVQNKFYLNDSGGGNRCLKPQVEPHLEEPAFFFLRPVNLVQLEHMGVS